MSKHTLVATVEEGPVVLNRVLSLFRQRSFAIESLSIGRTNEPGIMRLLLKHGADPRFVHHEEYVTSARRTDAHAYETRKETLTALMAATGMGGGTPWVEPDPREIRALTLEAVQMLVELGIDVNAANTDGRTALDAAKTLKNDAVVKFLVDKGAKPGTRNGPAVGRVRER